MNDAAALFREVSEADLTTVATLLRTVEDRYDGVARLDAMTILYTRLAELDAFAAYEHALGNGLALSGPWAVAWTDVIFRAWARQDLQAAVSVAGDVPTWRTATAAILAARSDLSARERTAIVRRLPTSAMTELLTAGDITRLVDDPKSALEQLDPSMHAAREAAAIAWTLRDGRAALNALDAETYTTSERLAREMIRIWARYAPQDAFAWALARDDEASRDRYGTAALEGLAARDPEQAATIAAGFGDVQLRARAVTSVLSNWVEQDPSAAIEWFASISEPTTRRQALRATASSYGRYDPDAAFAWARNLPPDESDLALEPILHWMAYARSAEKALQALPEIDDAAVRMQTTRRIVSEWTKADPEAAYRWADGQADAALREELTGTVLFSWGISNRAGLIEMVNGIEDSVEYELMVRRVTKYPILGGDDLIRAYERVSDPALKAYLAERVVQRFEHTDPARAETFRAEAGIADATR